MSASVIWTCKECGGNAWVEFNKGIDIFRCPHCDAVAYFHPGDTPTAAELTEAEADALDLKE